MSVIGKEVIYYFGTQAEYDAIRHKSDNVLYLISDTHRIYVGEVLYTGSGKFQAYMRVSDGQPQFLVIPAIIDMPVDATAITSYDDVIRSLIDLTPTAQATNQYLDVVDSPIALHIAAQMIA